MTQIRSNYAANAILNFYRGTAYPTFPTGGFWVALLTSAPTDRAGTGLVEVSGGSYARQQLPGADLNAPTTTGSGLTSIQNIISNANLTWPTASATWGTVVGVAFYDASTGGNFWEYGDLVTSQAVTTGNTFELPSGDITVQA